MKRGHCKLCFWTGKETTCKACASNYYVNTDRASPEVMCLFNFTGAKLKDKPVMPQNAQVYNGIEWPTVYINESVSTFFTIGDWGGVCGWGSANKCQDGVKPNICICGPDCGDPGKPCPMPNRGAGIKEIDGIAQRLVSDRMLERQKELIQQGGGARYIINVGDNFYPGGIDQHCGLGNQAAIASQFSQMWKEMYPGPLMEIEWWSILGNHDYGGVCYIKGWDQQIFYTWHDDKWVLPAQYWRRSVQYADFKVEFFFVDGNMYDTTPGTKETHDICNPKSNPGEHCENEFYPGDGGNCDATGPHNVDECRDWFKNLWEVNYKWLKEVVPTSDADWQIVVNHYPADFPLGYTPDSYMVWSDFLTPMGVDLYISGHTHEQKIFYGDFGQGRNMQDTAWVITGGGGGITSEMIPVANGDDDAYGFMEVVISLNSINITAYSHGGVEGKKIIRNSTSVKPVARHSYKRLVEAGLLTVEDVRLLPPEQSINSLNGEEQLLI